MIKMTFGYSYDLTKSTTLWRGRERAIFYINKFCFLSKEISGVQGFYGSEYPIAVNEDWSFSFNLKVEGTLQGANEGFVLGFGADKNQKFMNQKYKESQAVDNSLINQSGFSMWI